MKKDKAILTIQEADILSSLYQEPFINQRILAEASDHSLGVVNRALRSLISTGYLDEHVQLTAQGKKIIKERAPKTPLSSQPDSGCAWCRSTYPHRRPCWR